MMTVVRELFPLLVDASNALLKRHMVRVSYELWRPDDERAAVTHERTVGFADIVGSTETVRRASAAALAVAVRQFEERVWEVVADAGGRVVKLIGDEAMFVIEDPTRACDTALLVQQLMQDGKKERDGFTAAGLRAGQQVLAGSGFAEQHQRAHRGSGDAVSRLNRMAHHGAAGDDRRELETGIAGADRAPGRGRCHRVHPKKSP